MPLLEYGPFGAYGDSTLKPSAIAHTDGWKHVTQIILRFPKSELNTSSKPIFLRLPRRLLFDI